MPWVKLDDQFPDHPKVDTLVSELRSKIAAGTLDTETSAEAFARRDRELQRSFR